MITLPYQSRARLKQSIQSSLIPPEWRLDPVPPVDDVSDALEFIRTRGLLTAHELSITEIYDVNILLRKIACRQLSSLEVTKAFSKRAAFAHQLTNCCTEIFFEDGFTRARQLDEYLEKTGKLAGPLHGLPVSLKDLFHVKGVDACIGSSVKFHERANQSRKRRESTKYESYLQNDIGWVGLTNKPAVKDGNAAVTLRRLGAVLYVKTNVPQSMMVG